MGAPRLMDVRWSTTGYLHVKREAHQVTGFWRSVGLKEGVNDGIQKLGSCLSGSAAVLDELAPDESEIIYIIINISIWLHCQRTTSKK